jgi:uncharacterized protein RhaS with RHS repeats
MFRWYRAGWGRYTQADPASFEGGLNLYAYSLGNPLFFFDPNGLTSYKAFPPDKEQQLRDAVDKAKELLKANAAPKRTRCCITLRRQRSSTSRETRTGAEWSTRGIG